MPEKRESYPQSPQGSFPFFNYQVDLLPDVELPVFVLCVLVPTSNR